MAYAFDFASNNHRLKYPILMALYQTFLRHRRRDLKLTLFLLDSKQYTSPSVRLRRHGQYR